MTNIFDIELAKDDLNQALNTWISHIKNEKRVSPHTVDAYYRDINSFIHFLIEHIGGPLSLRNLETCLLYTSPSPRDKRQSRMPSSA